MALKGVKVLEFAGLAPAPFCGKILSDFGASVTRIDRVLVNQFDMLQHGKRTLPVNLKSPEGQQIVMQLADTHDVLIEPYRPGVMEKLNLGPDVLCKRNSRLIYARLTGFGQSGPLAKRAGHDINYAAISGVLSMLGQYNDKPTPPVNLLADFAGGGLMCAFGICLALLERHHSKRGQVVDAAMVDGSAYVASWLFMSRKLPIWNVNRGLGELDGGAFYYDTYETKDGKFMSVGALEPQFFDIFKERLGLSDLMQFSSDEETRKIDKENVRKAFLQKTQSEWACLFEDIDACVYPVVEWQQVMQHNHNKVRNTFTIVDGLIAPNPAPRLSRSPGSLKSTKSSAEVISDALLILKELNFDKHSIKKLIDDEVILLPKEKAKL